MAVQFFDGFDDYGSADLDALNSLYVETALLIQGLRRAALAAARIFIHKASPAVATPRWICRAPFPRSRTFWPSKLVQYQLPLCYNLLNIS